MTSQQDVDELLKRTDLRSADRAGVVAMATKLHRGEDLSYQERQNLWAYVSRYRGTTLPETRR